MAWIYQGDEISREDMTAKFKDTYVKLRKHGLCFIVQFDNASVEIAPLRSDRIWISAEDFEITQEWPKVGVMINYRKGAYKISRTPMRQWRIGLLRSTLRLTQGNVEIPVASLTADFVETLFNPKYVDLPKALELLSADRTSSYAISKYYWVRMNGNRQVELMRRDLLVGILETVKEGSSYIVRLDGCSGPFAQEIEDDFKNGKYSIQASV